MDIIKLLPDHVSNQIAAGEVIQRPASAAKEMLENALDAGATSITLIIKDAGKTLVQVIDNGCGMSETDARMSFERHATSKIRNADDLFSIRSMGFRGEALASMAAVAHMEMKSKLTNKDFGTHIIIEGSEIKKQESCMCTDGTSLSMKNLFFNVPARRNFLKSDAIELRHITEEFIRVALANPDVSMQLIVNDKKHYHLDKSNLRQRIVKIIGLKNNQHLVPIQEQTNMVSLEGFIAKPEYCKKTRGEQYFFVNKRFIKNAYLHNAIKKAYENLIPDSYFPSYYLHLEIDPQLIDINIHPTKTEIKFEDEQAIYSIIRSATKHALGKYNIAPTLDFNRELSFDSLPEKGKIYTQPQIRINPHYNPFLEESSTESNWTIETIAPENPTIQPIIDLPWQEILEYQNCIQILGQFIVFEAEGGLYIVHQQRAHQRILYEQLLQKESIHHAQKLIIPYTISIPTDDLFWMNKIAPQLNEMGFFWEELLDNTIELHTIPPACSEQNMEELFSLFLEQEKEQYPLENNLKNNLARKLAKQLSMKGKAVLEKEQMNKLMQDLFKSNHPSICPFGKPTIMIIDSKDILKQF